MKTVLNEAKKLFNSYLKRCSDLCREAGHNYDADFLDVAIWIANADGELAQSEIDLINELFNLSYTRREITEIYRQRVVGVDLSEYIYGHYNELERQSSDLASYYYTVILLTAGIMMIPDGKLHPKEQKIIEALETNRGVLVDDSTGSMYVELAKLAKRDYPLQDTIEYLNRIGVHGSEIKPQGMLVSAERCFRMTYLIATYLVLKYDDNEALLIQARSADKMGDISYNRFDLPDAERYTKIAVSLYKNLYRRTQWVGAREDIERSSKNLSRIQSEIKRIQDDVPQGIILGDVK